MSEKVHARSSGRGRRPFWFDPRFVIGLVLVAGSVVGVVAVVAANDTSVQVLAARAAIAPGQTVSADDLVTRSVRVGSAEKLYLVPADLADGPVVATRAVAAGEFVPASAVGSAAGLDVTSVVLSLTARLPQSVVEGTRLDVWAARSTGSGTFDAPTVIVSAATVVRIIDDDSLMAGSSSGTVEVQIPRSAIASVLESVANGAALSAIPVDLPLGS
jgi:hypothetical protein